MLLLTHVVWVAGTTVVSEQGSPIAFHDSLQ